MDQYDVYFEDKAVGTVTMEKNGLYMQIQCVCNSVPTGFYTLILSSDKEIINLGLLLPVKDGFGVNTCLPAARIGSRNRFHIFNSKKNNRKCVAADPTVPFKYLSDILNLKVQLDGKQLWILVDH